MKNRGAILIAFSALLILSPIVIRAVQIAQNADSGPPKVGFESIGNPQQDACEASTFRTSTYAFGCGARRERDSNRSRGAGGSLSVRVN